MKLKKPTIIIIIVANTLFLLVLFYNFYYKKASFDSSIKAEVPATRITKAYSEAGRWYWGNKEIDFYDEHAINLNKKEIAEFCAIINASHAKYIDNIRSDYWLDINLETIDKKAILITLNQNKTDGFFFEINHDGTFEGKALANFIVKHIHKQ